MRFVVRALSLSPPLQHFACFVLNKAVPNTSLKVLVMSHVTPRTPSPVRCLEMDTHLAVELEIGSQDTRIITLGARR